jgi:uncharacterized membrane protein (UPF0127 family)
MAMARIETADGRVVCERCLIADRWWPRMRGLLGRSELDPSEGILLRPAGSIHMMFMRFAIDAVFCDGELLVVGVVRGLKPWRAAGKRGAKVVIELADGAAAGVEPGDQLSLATIDS